MLKQPVPNRLWDYGICWVCEIMQCTASNSGRLHGRTPLEQLTGEAPNISEYLDFSFYDWCWYNDNAGLGETKLGRWLGVSHHVGSLMSYWVLTLKGHVISQTTVSRITNLEKQQTDVKHRLAEFDSAITACLNDDVHILVEGGKTQPQDWSEPVDDLDFLDEFHNVVSNPEVPEADQQFTPDVFDDRYLNMELALPHGDEATPQYAKVTKRLRDAMVSQSGQLMTTRFWTHECTKWSSWMAQSNHYQQITSLKTCLPRWIRMVTVKFYSTRSSITAQLVKR